MEAQVHVPKGFQGKKKGSRAEKMAIAKAQRARKKPKRKPTTRKRRTTRKGDLTLRRQRAYEPTRRFGVRSRKTNKDSMWNW